MLWLFNLIISRYTLVSLASSHLWLIGYLHPLIRFSQTFATLAAPWELFSSRMPQHVYCFAMRFPLLLLGGIGLLLTTCTSNAPVSPCYSGVVLGETCMDGVLIQVDEKYPIGQPAVFRFTSTDSISGSNVVAAVNNLGSLNKRGQRLYFTYGGDTQQPGPARPCTMNYARLSIPHLTLTNSSATSCSY
jgi:hypothetical protein